MKQASHPLYLSVSRLLRKGNGFLLWIHVYWNGRCFARKLLGLRKSKKCYLVDARALVSIARIVARVYVSILSAYLTPFDFTFHFLFTLFFFSGWLFSFVIRYDLRTESKINQSSFNSISSNDAREDVPSCARIAFRDNVDMLTHCLLIRDAFEIVFPRATSLLCSPARTDVSCAFFPIDRVLLPFVPFHSVVFITQYLFICICIYRMIS